MADNYLEEAGELVRQLRVRENFGDKLAGAAATTIMELIVAISEIKKNEARKAEEKKAAEKRAEEVAKMTPKVNRKKEENDDGDIDATIDSLLDGLDSIESEKKLDSFIFKNERIKTKYLAELYDKIDFSRKKYNISSWNDYKFGEEDL